MGLSESEKRCYQENGFLVIPQVFLAKDIKIINDAIDGLISATENSGRGDLVDYEPNGAGDAPVVRRLFHPFEKDDIFRRIATDDRILERVESLLGPNIALQHSKLNMKAPKVGGRVEWHQDMTYFPHTNADLVAVMIYLDDATVENGCVHVLARQHDRYFDHALPDGSFAGMITERIDTELYGTPVAAEGPAGSVLFLHPLTPHCSAANGSAKSRRLLIFEYRAADAFPIYNGSQLVSVEACAHHLRGEPARYARFGGPPPAIYLPQGSPKSLFELQEESRHQLKKRNE